MPFTFAHPAIILPLKQAKPGWFSLTALVAGSMAPDFEYFFKVKAVSTISETFAGIFVFNLPLVFVISILFHHLIRNPLIRHLPQPLDRRYSGFLDFHFLKYLRQHPWRFLASALIGILSHLALDILTSPETMTASFQKLQYLSQKKQLLLQAQLDDQPFLPVEKTFSIAGLLLLIYLLLKIKRPAPHYRKLPAEKKRKYFIVFFSLLAIGELAAVELLPYGTSFAQLVVNTISAGLLSLLITSLIFRKRAL